VALLTLLARLGTGVFAAYRISAGASFTLRGVAVWALAIAGVLALYDGGSLAVREETRMRYGRVFPGVVLSKMSSTGTDGSREIGRSARRRNPARAGRIVTINGFQLHDILARWLVTGSPSAWAVDYRFPCEAPRGCIGRDFVPEALWESLREGQTVNVRQGDGETVTARLDQNPQLAIAVADLFIGGLVLLLAKIVWSGLALFAAPRWITAPAVVVAVEAVPYADATHLRVRFAYFDPQGNAQESADEVAAGTWKVGDECVAVFRPAHPGLATLQPAPAS
jgi:hypothetical protein